MPVNQAHIEFFDDVKTLVVERFDRRWTENGTWLMRLPQEDICQALGVNSAFKYESDGGPGIQNIMELLTGSLEAKSDCYKFMKSVFLFWVLGAIDGHAKNFSVLIEPQGRYRLTPLYDVLSAYPLVTKRQLELRNLKMAMSLKSKSRHYHWYNILSRHWLVMASYCQFSTTMMQAIMDDVFDNMENVINQVAELLPEDFSREMSNLIFAGMRKVRRQGVQK